MEANSRFKVMAEVLPNNDRTRKIMAQREADEEKKRQELEDVRIYFHLAFAIPPLSQLLGIVSHLLYR